MLKTETKTGLQIKRILPKKAKFLSTYNLRKRKNAMVAHTTARRLWIKYPCG
jgi:hypothetical protein